MRLIEGLDLKGHGITFEKGGIFNVLLFDWFKKVSWIDVKKMAFSKFHEKDSIVEK